MSCWGGRRERPKSLRSHMEKQDAKLRQQISFSQHLSQRSATGPWVAWYRPLGTGFWPYLVVLPLAVSNQPVAVGTQEHRICCVRPDRRTIRFDQLCLGSGDRKSSAPQQGHINGTVTSLDWSTVVSWHQSECLACKMGASFTLSFFKGQ